MATFFASRSRWVNWDQAMIASGLYHLVQSTVGDEASAYHLQAGSLPATVRRRITNPPIGRKSYPFTIA